MNLIKFRAKVTKIKIRRNKRNKRIRNKNRILINNIARNYLTKRNNKKLSRLMNRP